MRSLMRRESEPLGVSAGNYPSRRDFLRHRFCERGDRPVLVADIKLSYKYGHRPSNCASWAPNAIVYRT